jgi:8-oxo-dGTP pyrophosphatase MutT (NUDIX family)
VEEEPRRIAAVLVPVFRDEDGRLRIVLIVRSDRGLHGGQLALPGGKADDSDDSLLATALREAEEEVGLRAHQVEVLAALDPLETMATGW